MNCKAVESNLSAYIDCELSGQDMLATRAHLAACPACRAEEQSLRCLKRMLCSMSAPAPRADFEERLLRCLSEERAPRRAEWVNWKTVTLFSGVAAAAMLVTLAVVARFRSEEESPAMAGNNITFEVQRDQIYSVGLDPTNGAPMFTSLGNDPR